MDLLLATSLHRKKSMSEQATVRAGAMKALWSDNACEFKKSAGQIGEPEQRLNLLTATFSALPAPPGYAVASESKSGSDGKTSKFQITGPDGPFYELEIIKGSDGKAKTVSEKPTTCQ
jgi:hypothetical protein